MQFELLLVPSRRFTAAHIYDHDIHEVVNKNVPLAHREGRTRSLQMTRKSLTLYPIELGGR
jgi:hypothetical protein